MKEPSRRVWNRKPLVILFSSFMMVLLVVLSAPSQSGKPPRPRLQILHVSTTGSVTIRVFGSAGRTNIMEASGDLLVWTPIATNVMNYSLCPICPFVDVVDSASNNQAHRFYRCYELY